MNWLSSKWKSWRQPLLACAVFLMAAGLWFSMDSVFDFAVTSNPQNSCIPGRIPETAVAKSRPDSWWMPLHDENVQAAQQAGLDVAFYGDSITAGMNEKLMHQIIGNASHNFGISGDGTQHLLWRFRNGELDFNGQPPKVAVVLIGTNNIWPSAPACQQHDVYLGVKADIEQLRQTLPDTKVLIVGVLPREHSGQHRIRAKVRGINSQIETLADNKRIWYVDIGDVFLDKNGDLPQAMMSDYLHPTAQSGYKAMFTALKPHIDAVLAAP